MANYSAIKATVNAYIKANGKKEITGRILNSVLNATIDSLGKEFQFRGVLTPADDPGQPDQNVAYIGAAGTYPNFDNLVIASGNIGIFLWNGDWSFVMIPVGKDYDNDIQSLTNELQELSDFLRNNVQELSENIQELSDDVIHLDGINEEDLSIPDGGELQFANRVYNAQQPNGMGYVILRKNKTFAEQVTKANTIYEIRYEFDLDGASVTIPSGCVLKFNGGEIQNGTLTGNGTMVDAEAIEIFSSVTVAGTWKVERIFSVWFAKDKYTIGNVLAMNNADIYTEIIIDGDYNVYVPISGTAGIAIVSNTKVNIGGRLTKDASSVTSISSVFSIRGNNVSVVGGIIDGNKDAFADSNSYGHGFEVADSFGCGLESVTIMNCHGDGIYVGGQNVNRNISIKNCEIYGCQRNGISVIFAQGFLVAETFIHDISGVAPGAAIDIEPNYSYQTVSNVLISNCSVEDCRIGFGIGGQAVVSDVLIDNATVNFSNNYDLALSVVLAENVILKNCKFNLTGDRSKTYNFRIDSTVMKAVLFDGCTILDTSANGYFLTGKTVFRNCKLSFSSTGFQTFNGIFSCCEIDTPKGLSEKNNTSGLPSVIEGCTISAAGSTFSGTETGYATGLIVRNNHFKITANYYPFNMQYVRDFVFEGNTFELAGNRNLFNVQYGENVRINSNRFIIGSNNNCVVFSSTCLSCQVKDNEFEVAEGVTHTAAKVSGINTTSSTTNKIGDPFFAGGKMVVYNGTSVVNVDGSALA